MADDISYIHSNKIAKVGRQYYDKYGVVYIGQRDGRLKKQEVNISNVQSEINKTITSVTPPDVVITTDSLSPLLLMGG